MLVLTRSEVIAVHELVTVAEVTTSDRGLSVEVPLDSEISGLSRQSVSIAMACTPSGSRCCATAPGNSTEPSCNESAGRCRTRWAVDDHRNLWR